jgi:hypothetical protein
MNTPSILDTLLAAFRDHTSATCGLDDRIANLTAELDRVPESCPSARGYLSLEICRAQDEQAGAARSIALRTALIYGLRTGKDGECNIDKPPIWPKGPPTKAESAARGYVESESPAGPPASTAPPKTPAPGPTPDEIADSMLDACASTPAADAFMAAIADDHTPGQARIVLRDRDWSDRDMDLLTSTALVEVARRNLRPGQVEITAEGGAGVEGGEVIP